MSYILDALKKAEAERKLGAVPGIHAPATYAARSDHRSGRKLWLAGALAMLAAMLAALAWFRPWQVAETLPRMPGPARLAPLPPAPPPVSTAPAPVAAPVLPAVQPPPVKPKAVARIVPPPARPRSSASAAPQPAPPPQAAQPAEQQDNEPLTLRELPEQIQREIPALKIGGYIYSSNPAERSLLINNKLLREGDEVAPGLTLEKMLRGSVVLNYKGYRYRMTY